MPDMNMEGAAPSAPKRDTTNSKRKRPAHMPLVDAGNRSTIVFVTACAKDRKHIFARADIHRLLVASWTAALDWRVGRYVIMPDHVHLFCSPAIWPEKNVRSWMKFWKSSASRAWPRPSEQPIWQQDAWDTQLRRGQSYGEKWDYIRNNPVRAGLVEHADNWPFQGELNVLMWHDP